MSTRKTSIIWTMPKSDFQSLVDKCSSLSQVMSKLGFKSRAGSLYVLKDRISEDAINLQKLRENGIRARNGSVVLPLKDLLTVNSSYSRGHLKKRLIVSGLLENKCNECGMSNKWNGKELVLVLDHSNGINNDNRLSNLRLLCPNCNSQTSTFAGRNGNGLGKCVDCGKAVSKRAIRCRGCWDKEKLSYRSCEVCGKPISKRSKRCLKCQAYSARVVIERPSKEDLGKGKATKSWLALGRQYGVSGNAVKKWARQYGILAPVEHKADPL